MRGVANNLFISSISLIFYDLPVLHVALFMCDITIVICRCQRKECCELAEM